MLKLILLFLISETPSAFIPRRQIFYNLLIAYKLVHFLKRRNIRKWGYMSIKLDMSKIYDRVEWDYLETVMTVLVFKQNFIYLILQCVSSTSFSVLINGTPKRPYFSNLGVEERGSSILYLFLLYTGGLISLHRCSNANI